MGLGENGGGGGGSGKQHQIYEKFVLHGLALLIRCQICKDVYSDIQQPAKKTTVDSVNKESQVSDETCVFLASDGTRRTFVPHSTRNLVHTKTVSFDDDAQISGCAL